MIYATSNDGKLYCVNLQKLQNPEDLEDDILDDEGDDGDMIDGDPEGSEGEIEGTDE